MNMNNGFNNNYGYQPQGGFYGGMVYNPQPQKIHMTQGLTPEQLKSLRKTSGGFNLDISNEEILRSYCTHRNEEAFTVVYDDEGYATCTLCGTRFKTFNGSPADAKALTDEFIGLLESTKMRAITLAPKTIQDVFQTLPIITRIPDLYEKSINDAKRVMNTNDTYTMGQENNAFNYYNTMLNPSMNTGYYDPALNPAYGMQMQQPPMGQQFMGQPQMQQGYGMQMQQPAMGQQFMGQPQMQQGYGMQMQQQYMGQQQMQQQDQGNPFSNSGNNKPEEKTVSVNKKLTD